MNDNSDSTKEVGRNKAADILGVSTSTFDRLVKEELFKPSSKTPGGRAKYKVSDLLAAKKIIDERNESGALTDPASRAAKPAKKTFRPEVVMAGEIIRAHENNDSVPSRAYTNDQIYKIGKSLGLTYKPTGMFIAMMSFIFLMPLLGTAVGLYFTYTMLISPLGIAFAGKLLLAFFAFFIVMGISFRIGALISATIHDVSRFRYRRRVENYLIEKHANHIAKKEQPSEA